MVQLDVSLLKSQQWTSWGWLGGVGWQTRFWLLNKPKRYLYLEILNTAIPIMLVRTYKTRHLTSKRRVFLTPHFQTQNPNSPYVSPYTSVIFVERIKLLIKHFILKSLIYSHILLYLTHFLLSSLRESSCWSNVSWKLDQFINSPLYSAYIFLQSLRRPVLC